MATITCKGVLFREAHEPWDALWCARSNLVWSCRSSLADLRFFSEVIADDVFEALSLTSTLNSKSQIGGTSGERVHESLAIARASLLS